MHLLSKYSESLQIQNLDILVLKKIRQIEGRSAVLSQNVNKVSRFFLTFRHILKLFAKFLPIKRNFEILPIWKTQNLSSHVFPTF